MNINSNTQMENFLFKYLPELAKNISINELMEKNLKDLGIKSLAFVRIIVLLEKEFKVDFSKIEINFNNPIFLNFKTILNYISQQIN